MIYIRGNRADYDGWAAMGHDGLGLGRRPPLLHQSRGQRARRGASCTGPAVRSRSARAARATALRGVHRGRGRGGPAANDDFNGPAQDGVGWYQFTQRNGMRCSAAVAYLHPAMGGPTWR